MVGCCLVLRYFISFSGEFDLPLSPGVCLTIVCDSCLLDDSVSCILSVLVVALYMALRSLVYLVELNSLRGL